MTRNPFSELLASLSFLLAAASAHAASVPTDQALAKSIRGVWCVSEDQGKTCLGYDQIIDSETSAACGDYDGELLWGRGTHAVRGSEVCYEMTATSHPEVTPVGYRFCAIVLSIDDEKQTYKFPDNDKVHTMYRTSLTSLPCLEDE